MPDEPYFDDGLAKLYRGDSRSMTMLADQSVHCIICSPPYYNQRVYSDLEPLVWGGIDHDHQWTENSFQRRSGDGGGPRKQTTNPGANQRDVPIHYAWCECGAWRGNLGNEPNLSLYIDHLLQVFRECWRVLREDGLMWVNMMSSYGGRSGGNRTSSPRRDKGALVAMEHGGRGGDILPAPYFLALALQVDGWIFRSDCIWLKSTVMPISVHGWVWKICCDGCSKCSGNGGMVLSRGSWRSTTNHEYIFQFAKKMGHYGDGEAVNLAVSDSTWKRLGEENPPSGVNRRTVWPIKRDSYGSHGASFPRGLPRVCIMASTPPSVCSKCQAPWARVEETEDFRPTCRCDTFGAPALVVDPFGGSGTTSVEASALGRASVGIDLSHDFLRQAAIRIAGGIVAK